MKTLFNVATILLILIFGSTVGNSYESNKAARPGICQCAIFHSDGIPGQDKPIFSGNRTFLALKSENGASRCKRLCVDTAVSMKKYASQFVCRQLKNADNVKVMLYSRLCCEQWKSTGLSNEEPICCMNGFSIACSSDSTNVNLG